MLLFPIDLMGVIISYFIKELKLKLLANLEALLEFLFYSPKLLSSSPDALNDLDLSEATSISPLLN